jgi:hypothetical protein
MPGIIYEDNEGAIFLAKNQQVGMRTKHIDVKYHFIRDLVADNYLDLRYVRSEDNYADLMTKNVSNEVFERLFLRGVQLGTIVTKRENVGRTSTCRTDVRSTNSFTYDGSYRDREDDATDGLNGRNKTGFKTPVSVTG